MAEITVHEASQMVNIAQAVAIAGVTRRTIYNWINAGKLRYTRTAGGRLRIDPASLFLPHDDALLNAREGQ